MVLVLRTVIIGLSVICGAESLFGQTVGDRPKFDAASFRLAQGTAGVRMGNVREAVLSGFAANSVNPGRVRYSQERLLFLVPWAYGVEPYQVSGPNWWSEAFYDLEAVFPPGTSGEQVRLMAQVLLEERLHLSFHLERRNIPVYAVVVAKGGQRLQESVGQPKVLYSVSIRGTERRLTGTLSVPSLLKKLSPEADRPLVDLTGIEGDYQISLSWDVDRESPLRRGSLFPEMERQLGLKVQARTTAADTLVVDHVDRVPVEN